MASSAELKGIEKLASLLEDPKAAEALARLLETAVRLEESGLLELIEALADEKVLRSLADLVLTTGALRLLDNLDKLLDIAGEAVGALSKPAEPVGLSGLLRALAEPDVQAGLGRLVNLLRALGRA